MKKAATSEKLQQAFADHLVTVTNTRCTFGTGLQILGKKAQAKKCDAMAGILEEGNGIPETEKGTATLEMLV